MFLDPIEDLNFAKDTSVAFIDAAQKRNIQSYIFTFDGLQMQYDTKGQVWGEDYMGFNFECVGTDQLVGAVQAWGDGNHTFLVIFH